LPFSLNTIIMGQERGRREREGKSLVERLTFFSRWATGGPKPGVGGVRGRESRGGLHRA